MSQKVKTNLVIDLILLIIFLIAYEEKATGTAIHEWLGVVFVLFLLGHIILHWNWLVETTKRFFGRKKAASRLNYVLDMLIYLGFTTIIFTGLMISESFLPFLGIRVSENHFWQEVHFITVDVTLFLVALHFALHWKWIVTVVRRYLIDPFKKDTTSKSRNPKSVAFSSTKPKPSFLSKLPKVSVSLIIILGIAGLISLGLYTAVGSDTSRLASHERHGEFRSPREESRNPERLEHQGRGLHRRDGEHRAEGHHGDRGYHEEGGMFGIELGKNLLIFALVTLAVILINKLYNYWKRPKFAMEG